MVVVVRWSSVYLLYITNAGHILFAKIASNAHFLPVTQMPNKKMTGTEMRGHYIKYQYIIPQLHVAHCGKIIKSTPGNMLAMVSVNKQQLSKQDVP